MVVCEKNKLKFVWWVAACSFSRSLLKSLSARKEGEGKKRKSVTVVVDRGQRE